MSRNESEQEKSSLPRLGIVAPAGAARSSKRVAEAIKTLQRQGFEIQLGKNFLGQAGYLAGSDTVRVRDLQKMVESPNIDLIMALRGGYGCIRLLPMINFQLWKKQQRSLVGFSDITALHLALLKNGIQSVFHGPTLLSLTNPSDEEAAREYSLQKLLDALDGTPTRICDGYAYRDRTVEVIRKGTAQGKLVGGNLTVVASLIGTPYLPSFRGKIFFFEDTNEPPYRIDRLLTQLLLSGKLNGITGIAVGMLRDHQHDPLSKTEGDAYAGCYYDVIAERLSFLKVPIVVGLPFGHVGWNATLPMGRAVNLDGRRGDIVW